MVGVELGEATGVRLVHGEPGGVLTLDAGDALKVLLPHRQGSIKAFTYALGGALLGRHIGMLIRSAGVSSEETRSHGSTVPVGAPPARMTCPQRASFSFRARPTISVPPRRFERPTPALGERCSVP